MSWLESLERRWAGPGGGREVALIAYPLILGHLSFTLQTFVDRLFLTWYSAEAVAGAVTGLFAVWAIIALFTGTGEYLTTFVAQYFGAGRPKRIGAAMWQGIYFSLAAGILIAALAPLAGPAFDLAGHEPALRRYEVEYARVLMWGAFPVILMATLSTFFAGRGETRVILYVNILATLVNVGLDWLLIFGNAGFPEMGVTGAALGTVLSQVAGAGIYLAADAGAPAPRGVRDARRLAARAVAHRAALPLRDADGPAVLARGRGVRPVHGDRGPHRHARAGGERDRVQPEHDRLLPDGRPRDRGLVARRTLPRVGPAGRGRAGRGLGLRDEHGLHDALRPRLHAGRFAAARALRRPGGRGDVPDRGRDRDRAAALRGLLLDLRHAEPDPRGRPARGGRHALPDAAHARARDLRDAAAGRDRLRAFSGSASTSRGAWRRSTCSCSGC